jgi:hypothetical protein
LKFLHGGFLLFRKELLANYLALSLIHNKKLGLQKQALWQTLFFVGAFFLLERFNYVSPDLNRVRCSV